MCKPIVQPEAPSAVSETSGVDTVRCSNHKRPCDWTGPRPASGHCPRCGSFTSENVAAMTHGARRIQLRGAVDMLARSRVDELRTNLTRDCGDEPATRAIVVDRLAETTLLAEMMWAHIAAVSPLTKTGKARAVVALYLQASDRATKLAALLGLSRQPKSIPTLADYIAAHYPAASTPPAAPASAPAANDPAGDASAVPGDECAGAAPSGRRDEAPR